MSIINNTIYKILCIARNESVLNTVNNLANIDNYNLIIPNLYLGNIKGANNLKFLKKKNIQAIVNCTENEPFHEYFEDKLKLRLSINDSLDEDNMNKFKDEIMKAINFIDQSINENKNVYVHCYWGLMRSATVVTGYLMKKYKLSMEDAIDIVKEQRPMALSSIYNFNEILKVLEDELKEVNNP